MTESSSMLTSSSRTLLVPTLRSRSLCALLSTLSQRIKLAEVPDICASEEWNSVIQRSRAALQTHALRHENLNADYSANISTVQAVIRRLRCASRNSDHLIDTFRYLVGNSDETAGLLRWPGLIILMLSQSIDNPFAADNFISKKLEDVIWSSQIVLAEIINTLHCSLVFRRENMRVSSSKKNQAKSASEIDRLMTSYFTSSSLYKLSTLKNHKVVFLLSDVLESLAKSKKSSSSDFSPITNKHLWEYETFHSQGTLLANGCQATLELAGHGDKSQEMAFEFGHLFILAMKANADIQQFCDYQTTKSSSLNISGFPIAVHLESNPETLEHVYNCKEMDNLDIDQVNAKFISSSCLNEAKHHLEEYVSRTLIILQNFNSYKNSEMVEYLMKLVKTLNHINEN